MGWPLGQTHSWCNTLYSCRATASSSVEGKVKMLHSGMSLGNGRRTN